jgi:hypothetical protein
VSFNCAVAGIGIDHDSLVHAVRKMTIKQGNVEQGKKAKYYGGMFCNVNCQLAASVCAYVDVVA